MSPEVLARKLALLRTYVSDLAAYDRARTVKENHYAVERIIQLIVEGMYDMMSHWLTARHHVSPDSYQDVLAEAARRSFISQDLARRLVNASKMRNLLVHAYEHIDLDKLEKAIPAILADVDDFLTHVSGKGLG
jgi:uncharacterized protein YutE (UPF0331/DUF86 family)